MLTLKRIALSGIGATMLLLPGFTYATSCPNTVALPPEAFSAAAAVFSGTIIQQDSGSAFVTTTLSVDRIWKGKISSPFIIRTSIWFTPFYGENNTFLVYAYPSSDGALSVDTCSRTKLMSGAQEDLAYLANKPLIPVLKSNPGPQQKAGPGVKDPDAVYMDSGVGVPDPDSAHILARGSQPNYVARRVAAGAVVVALGFLIFKFFKKKRA